jgi:phage repressor protein C with HTH and peptisase S24 domain
VLDVQAAAGAGRAADVVRAVRDLEFPAEFLKKIAAPDAQLSCLRAAGDSMAPTIEDGALLFVDERQRTPRPFRSPSRRGPRERQKPDDIFIFIQSGDLRLKRLRDLGDGFIAILSDNHHGYPIEIVKPGRDGALAVIGKVIWWDNRL